MSNIFEERKWVNEFIDLYFSRDAENVRRAIALKDEHIPRSLFRYRSLDNAYVFDEIEREVVYLSKPEDFNDPFDCVATFSMKEILRNKKECEEVVSDGRKKISDHDMNIILDVIDTVLEKERKDFTKKYNDFTRECLRICCFTEGNTQGLPTNIPLWYHYANKFHGVCIEYDMRYFQSNSIHRLLMYPVKYVPQQTDFTDIMSEFIEGKKFFVDRLIAIHKALEWSYEKEWRLILHYDEISPTSQLYLFPAVKAVYMGKDILQEHEKRLTQLAEEYGFSLYKMDIHYLGVTFNQIVTPPDRIIFKEDK